MGMQGQRCAAYGTCCKQEIISKLLTLFKIINTITNREQKKYLLACTPEHRSPRKVPEPDTLHPRLAETQVFWCLPQFCYVLFLQHHHTWHNRLITKLVCKIEVAINYSTLSVFSIVLEDDDGTIIPFEFK